MDIIKQQRGLIIFEGFIFTLLGMLAVAVPGLTTLGTELFFGWLFIIGGLTGVYRSIKGRESGGFIGSLLVALLYVIFGVLLLAYPLIGVISLTLILAAFFIIEGISKILFGFQIKADKNWFWLVLSGIISLIMAGIIFSGWPETAIWVIGLLVGINMIFLGITLLFIGFNLPKEEK